MCKSRAAHRALITRNMSCATWYEGTAQLLSLTELKSRFFFRLNHFVELLGPNFQQKFVFWGRSMQFGGEILLTMLYLNIDRSKTSGPLYDLDGRDISRYAGHASFYPNKWLMH